MGGSAGAIGTESNCDAFANRLHEFNPGSEKLININIKSEQRFYGFLVLRFMSDNMSEISIFQQ